MQFGAPGDLGLVTKYEIILYTFRIYQFQDNLHTCILFITEPPEFSAQKMEILLLQKIKILRSKMEILPSENANLTLENCIDCLKTDCIEFCTQKNGNSTCRKWKFWAQKWKFCIQNIGISM